MIKSKRPKRVQQRKPQPSKKLKSTKELEDFQMKLSKVISGGVLNSGSVIKSSVKQPSIKPRHESELASSVVRQILDPCNSPPATLPDQYHGKTEFVTSSTAVTFALTASGDRYFEIQPCAKELIEASGTSAFSTTVTTDDQNLALMEDDYKYIRLVGMCAKVSKVTAYDTPNGQMLARCFVPDTTAVFPADAATALAQLTRNGAQQQNIAEGFEIGWCPQRQVDFVPFAPGSTYDDNQDLNGQNLNYRPIIGLYISGAISTQIRIEVTARWECFLLPSKYARGVDKMIQSSTAMDLLMSAIPQLCFVKEGSLVHTASTYASKVAGVLAGKGWEAITSSALAKITC